MKNQTFRWRIFFRSGMAFFALLAFSASALAAGRADAAPDRLGVTMDDLLASPKSGFFLLRFNGRDLVEEPLQILSRDGIKLVVGLPDRETPRFIFRIGEDPDFLAIHLEEARGDFSGRDLSLAFRSQFNQKLEAIPLNYMGKDLSRDSLSLVWPYLWNTNKSDPLGSFAVFKAGTDEQCDESLAAIWAEGTLPHPDLGVPWTKEKVKEWVDAYNEKYEGLSETTISAKSSEELYQLTDWLHRTGVRRVYLHTDTWRGEYWPVTRSFVSVNPDVFPGGREDLKRYREYLKKKGMQLRLHSVSGGIGGQDPEFFAADRVDSRLSTWVKGRLEAPVSATANEMLFRPDPGAELPHLRLGNYWNMLTFRIGGEVLRAAELLDVDGPVWRLKGLTRGQGKTPATAHEAGEEMAGLLSAYGKNFVADSRSDLFGEMASRYAKLINEAELDHQHYDGGEIHVDVTPWGFDKFTFLVARQLNRPVTSSTSSGSSVPWNFEYRFSKIRALKELSYFGASIPVLLDGHRNASSWLDANYAVASTLSKTGGLRLGFAKPEPMFGVSPDIIAGHGLMPRFEQIFRDWHAAVGSVGDKELAYLRGMFTPVKSQLRQAGQHSQSYDVPVLVKRADGYAIVPTRVMLRDGLDAPWLTGQEFGPVGPRQYLQPGDHVVLTNPYSAQPPDLVLHVLPALGVGSSLANGAPASDKKAEAMLESYRAGTEKTQDKPQENSAPASPAADQPAPTLMPALAKAVAPAGDTQLEIKPGQIELTARNASSKGVWEEAALPSWKCKIPLLGRRGVALDVVGDGSGAVLLMVLDAGGKRDYVIKIDFTGPRHIVIPNGEAAWSEGCWGWRFGAKHFDYEATLGAVSLGFGFIPPNTSPHVVITDIKLLDNLTGILRDPVIHLGSGKLQVAGEILTGEYLTYSPAEGAKVFDRNWKFLRALESKPDAWLAPQGPVDVCLENASPGPQPWFELQLITRGEPFPLPASPKK
ncbi:MAG: hypothetical protein WCH98_05445 [Verrucomicrobiota bacterium]